MDFKKLLDVSFLRQLKHKLSIGNARSIYLNCIPGRYKGRLQLTEFDDALDDVSHTILTELLTKPSFNLQIAIPEVEDEESTSKELSQARKILKSKLEYIISEEKSLKDNLGINTVHFGYPVLAYKKQKDSKMVYAPLLLWEIEIAKNYSKKSTYVISRRPESSVRVNDMLTILLEEDAKVKLGPINEEHLEDGLISYSELKEIIDQINLQLYHGRSNLQLNTVVEELISSDNPKVGWINTGIFGHFKHLKTPIIKEIDRLILELSSGQITSVDIDYQSQRPITSVEIDPSQEQIVSALHQDKNIIIQGPPGTGKSQTISAIIANVLAHNGKCLVVCEKDAALNVIKNNLISLGLDSKLILKIVDPIVDRKLFADFMSSALSHQLFPKATVDNQLNKLVETNNKYLEEINSYKNALYDTSRLDTPLRDLIGTLSKINREKQYPKNVPLNDFNETSVNLDEYKNVLKVVEGKFRKVQSSLNLLNRFNEDYVLTLNPILYRDLSSQLDNLYKLLFKLIEDLFSINEKTSGALFKRQLNISILDKVIAAFSSEVKLINEQINNTKRTLLEVEQIKTKLPIHFNATQSTHVIEYFNEVKQLHQYLEDIITIEEGLLFDYKDLLNTVSSLSSSLKSIYSAITSDQELVSTEDWSTLIEKSLIEYNLKDLTSIPQGTNITSKINDLIETQKQERALNTNNINLHFEQMLYQLSNLPNWSSIKFYLSQKRESTARGPRKTLQYLFNNYLNEILTISPVILTTPVTANVLFAGKEKVFDLVIFDEASQLRLEDTVTCMLLGKKIIVSGDIHQMPPSDYFDSGITFEGGEYEDVIETDEPIDSLAESLLAFSYGLGNYFKDWMLEYHYRSKHPDLIEFSNYAFYGKRLVPIPNQFAASPIEFMQIDGTYVQKKRINIAEAQAIVELLKSDQISTSQSVGIATLNINQRDLIRDLISQEMENNDEFTEKIRLLEESGLFIKNLENIQGDERDVIILSVTFGVNEQGAFNAFFGKINNRQKGYKLLNVLITRAKEKLYIFNSIPKNIYAQFNQLRLNKSELISGKEALYAYLAYAEAASKGDHISRDSILSEISIEQVNSNNHVFETFSESPFEEEVYNLLTKIVPKNRIIQQYRVGGFRIDMVILDEQGQHPILAIECDGEAYHSSEIARGWDIYRQKMLERMGFIFHRIWSPDWWTNSNREILRIAEALKAVKNN